MIALKLDELVRETESLPKLPDTTFRLMRVLKNPASTVRQIVDVIRYDQTVTTRLLRLCNSAYFGLSRQIVSIDDAVRYMGTAKLMKLVMTAHSQALLAPEQTGYGLPPGALWSHSVAVALGCEVVADQLGMEERGTLFTVGLLHDIGKTVLNEHVGTEYATIVERVNEQRISFDEAEREVLGVTHSEVGELVAKRWNLPQPIPRCIRYHHEPASSPRTDASIDVVHIADAACLLFGIGGGDDGQMYRVDEAVLERTGLREADVERIGAGVVAELKVVQEHFKVE
jgi:putative nucleotidyltransferase with HDIG domain